jgi:hypothetical protein
MVFPKMRNTVKRERLRKNNNKNFLIQQRALLASQCSDITTSKFAFIKYLRSSIDLEIRPQSAFPAFRALLPSANYSAE